MCSFTEYISHTGKMVIKNQLERRSRSTETNFWSVKEHNKNSKILIQVSITGSKITLGQCFHKDRTLHDCFYSCTKCLNHFQEDLVISNSPSHLFSVFCLPFTVDLSFYESKLYPHKFLRYRADGRRDF